MKKTRQIMVYLMSVVLALSAATFCTQREVLANQLAETADSAAEPEPVGVESSMAETEISYEDINQMVTGNTDEEGGAVSSEVFIEEGEAQSPEVFNEGPAAENPENIAGEEADASVREVSTEEELRDALADSTVTTIRLLNDISLDTVAPLKINRDLLIQSAKENNEKAVIFSVTTKRHFTVTNVGIDINLRFENVVLDGQGVAGGIGSDAITLTLTGAYIQNCLAESAGGAINAKSLIMTDSTIIDNKSPHQGGGLYLTEPSEIYNSTITGNIAQSNGGGISASRGVKLENTKVTSGSNDNPNKAHKGGGVYMATGNLVMEGNSEVSGNVANNGGGVFIYYGGYIAGGIIKNNKAEVSNLSESGKGGGVFINMGVTLYDVSIQGNTAIKGGGIYGGDNSIITMEQVNIGAYAMAEGNKAVNGGGICSTGSVNIHGSKIYGNEAAVDAEGLNGFGGGIMVKGLNAVLSVETSTISDNRAVMGGGVYSGGVNVNIINAKVSQNMADSGGGVWVESLDDLETNYVEFEDNSGSESFEWAIDPLAQSGDSRIHIEQIRNTTYTVPFTNAYNNCDVNYYMEETVYSVKHVDENNHDLLIPVIEVSYIGATVSASRMETIVYDGKTYIPSESTSQTVTKVLSGVRDADDIVFVYELQNVNPPVTPGPTEPGDSGSTDSGNSGSTDSGGSETTESNRPETPELSGPVTDAVNEKEPTDIIVPEDSVTIEWVEPDEESIPRGLYQVPINENPKTGDMIISYYPILILSMAIFMLMFFGRKLLCKK